MPLHDTLFGVDGDATWPGPRGRHGGVDELTLPPALAAGRLWLCGKHYVGPDPEAALSAVGASGVVCLNERHELADRYPRYVRWLEVQPSARALWQPMPDLGAPSIDVARALLAELWARLVRGEHLLLHCGAGIGRAGTVAAGLLVLDGATPAAAVATVAAHRPMAGPEAGPQEELLQRLAGHGGVDRTGLA